MKKKSEYPDKIRVRASIDKKEVLDNILDKVHDNVFYANEYWIENANGFEFVSTQTWTIDNCLDEFDGMVYDYFDDACCSHYDFVDYISQKYENDKFVIEFEAEKFDEPDDNEYVDLLEDGFVKWLTSGIVFELIRIDKKT